MVLTQKGADKMGTRTLSADEIKFVNEINEKAQELDLAGKAKVIGFIAGLTAKSDTPKVRRYNKPATAAV